jgi:excinuclease ABC subunit B
MKLSRSSFYYKPKGKSPERVKVVAEMKAPYITTPATQEGIARLIKELESQMKSAAKNLEFEKAALLRDRIYELRRDLDPININAGYKYARK